MTCVWTIDIADERRLRLLAEVLATKVAGGDMITLQGGLGAGKTTFCRYLIRAMIGDDAVEVPSPTFTLVQTYETPRCEVRHFDLYRLASPDELHELEFEDERGDCLTLVEWPERAEDLLGHCRMDITITDGGDANARQISIAATPDAAWRLGRTQAAYEFLCAAADQAALDRVRVSYLQGDASTRAYAYVRDGAQSRILMDMPKLPDGPVVRDGKTYSEIAHIAEDARPFVAIAGELSAAGLSAPEIYAFDQPRGMALIEDLGPLTFAEAIARGVSQAELWRAAIEVLLRLRRFPPREIVGKGGDVAHAMPYFDAGVIRAELDLLCDWYWPYAMGREMSAQELDAFRAAWAAPIEKVAAAPGQRGAGDWLLRDFHSPNLIWMPERHGVQRVGVIDFQDAQIGHAAYDVVSLTLDARLDVPRALHEALIDTYCSRASVDDTGFDETGFRLAAAILGAQRNTKILGIFARLSKRDGKHGYLRHMPRIKRYLSWCLENPELSELRMWYNASLGLDPGAD